MNMNRVEDFVMEKLLFPMILTLILGLVVALAIVMYHVCREAWYPSPTFELRVDSWTCTKYVHEVSTSFVLVGKVMIPMTSNTQRCVQWDAHE